jgi:hypothetical protein
MIANLIGGFIAILVGASLITPVSNEVVLATQANSGMANISGWGVTVLKLVPGFFALGILGVGVACTYSALRQAGIV